MRLRAGISPLGRDDDGLRGRNGVVRVLDREADVERRTDALVLLHEDRRVERGGLRGDATEVEDLLIHADAEERRAAGHERRVARRGDGRRADTRDVDDSRVHEARGRVVGGAGDDLRGRADGGIPLRPRAARVGPRGGDARLGGEDLGLVRHRVREGLIEPHGAHAGGGLRRVGARELSERVRRRQRRTPKRSARDQRAACVRPARADRACRATSAPSNRALRAATWPLRGRK